MVEIPAVGWTVLALAPAALMAAAWPLARWSGPPTAAPWRAFQVLSLVALGLAAVAGFAGQPLPAGLKATPFGAVMALLVQGLGCVIGGFSARYLDGEPQQRRYIGALGAVLAGVHLLLLADHWLLLIAAWAAVGLALQQLLCFYPERPFAQLAAHKKRIADRAADALLLAAAALAWGEVGSGSLSDLWAHIAQHGSSTALQLSALALVAAVILRTALLPVHGWLIQVMEAPTPVSALLHAGVVNLGGFVLIRFAPLLEQAPLARALLLGVGLATAVLAGMVMECALGLYTLAALHLVGHSLYKAHAFLAASSAVRHTRLQALHAPAAPGALSVVLAPLLTGGAVLATLHLSGSTAWPWWWSAVLALAWAPLLWLPKAAGAQVRAVQGGFGLLAVAGLTGALMLAHALPLGLADSPHAALGAVALAGMAALYLGLALLQLRPAALARWRRWSYAGFYVDEAYTRLALGLWPARWTPAAAR
jgi:NAD(P)H-quinone oxidoreductase subunit 5